MAIVIEVPISLKVILPILKFYSWSICQLKGFRLQYKDTRSYPWALWMFIEAFFLSLCPHTFYRLESVSLQWRLSTVCWQVSSSLSSLTTHLWTLRRPTRACSPPATSRLRPASPASLRTTATAPSISTSAWPSASLQTGSDFSR